MKRRSGVGGGASVGVEQGGAPGGGEDAALQRAEVMQRMGVLQEIGELAAAGVTAPKLPQNCGAQPSREHSPTGQPTGQPGHRAERRIAAEEFIAAEPRKYRGHASRARSLAGVVGVDPVAGRLVEAADKFLNVARDFAARQNPGLVNGSDVASGGFGGGGLREFVFVETDGKRVQRLAGSPCHQSRDDRGIESTG